MNHRTTIDGMALGLRRSLVAGGLGLGLLVASSGPAFAQAAGPQSSYGGTGGTDQVRGVVEAPPVPAAPSRSVAVGTAKAEVLGNTQSSGGSGLPVTGSDVAGLALAGAGLIAVGVIAVKGARRSALAA